MADGRTIGPMRDRLHFQSRPAVDDGWGTNQPGQGAFTTQFTRFAALQPRVGGEAVTAARLDGRQPYVVRVRRDPQTIAATTAWRLVDENDAARVFNIISPPADPDGKREWLEFLAEEGRPS